MGLSSTTFTDTAAPDNLPLYYLVRAENNETCSTGPNNNGVVDDNAVYLMARDDLSQAVPGDVGPTLRGANVASTTVRLTWQAASGATGYRVYRANNAQMTGAVLLGSAGQLVYEDTGEVTLQPSRYYLVKGINPCGIEGP